MESESLDQPFFFHLAFFFLIFIIVITFSLPEMAMATKSIVVILHFCCINIVVLLANLHKKMKGQIREVSLDDVWGSGKVRREKN